MERGIESRAELVAGIGQTLSVGSPKLREAWALSKPRVTLLVWATTLFGLILAGGFDTSPWLVVNTLLGSWFVIASANALNQVREMVPDSKMKRTAGRPLPSGRLSSTEGLAIGVCWAVVGLAQLAIFVNPLTAFLGALSISIYVFAYTPLKTRTHLATAVGAIPGAIPPLAGYAAVTGRLDLPGILLFAIQFFWQFPHFWAIAWILREDYQLVGFRMLPYPSADGRATGLCSIQFSVPLIPLSLLYGAFIEYSIIYWVGATLLSGWVVFAAFQFWSRADDLSAKKLLRVSVLYLPLLLVLMICTR